MQNMRFYPFISNGKEKDYESGFLYYGARYHWPELWTGWTTPDPMADKYPGLSPYNYCNLNPVIFVDPDGRDTFYIELDKGRIYQQKAKGDHCIRFRIDEKILEDNTMIGIKSQINYEKSGTWNVNGFGTTDYLEFSDEELGKNVFDVITRESALIRSAKEWDYYYFKGLGGELSSSGRDDKMVHAPQRYTLESVTKWHHFHPNNTSKSWFPSYSDQQKSRSLHVPSYLHNQGNTYRFDQVIRKRNITPSNYRKKMTVY